MLDSLRPLDFLPLESNSNHAGYFGTWTNKSPHGEQILPGTSYASASVPRFTLDEPPCGHSTSQGSRVPEATLQIPNQSPGASRPPNPSSAVPSGQGGSPPDIFIPSETPQFPTESPAHTRNEGINQNTDEILLEDVVPEKGPMTGGIGIALFGENFPDAPLYAGFGDNWVRAVSHTRYHYPFWIDPKICGSAGAMPVLCDAVSLDHPIQVLWR